MGFVFEIRTNFATKKGFGSDGGEGNRENIVYVFFVLS